MSHLRPFDVDVDVDLLDELFPRNAANKESHYHPATSVSYGQGV